MRAFERLSSPSVTPVSLDDVVAGVLTFLENELANQNIRIETHLAADLPKIQGEDSQLQQVFINILTNAADAIRESGSKDRAILIEGVCRDSQLVFTIRDTGGGMSNTQLQKMFDPFYTTEEAGKGMGLGGSISYGILKSLGGTIRAGNWEKGAEITLTFPALHTT